MLGDFYLEDSWVLDVNETPGSLSFRVDAVLTEGNPRYHPPYPNEQYCYAHVRIIFAEASAVNWIEYRMRPSTDITGEVDYGHIDSLVYNEDHYELEGDWGMVHVYSKVDSVVTHLDSMV